MIRSRARLAACLLAALSAIASNASSRALLAQQKPFEPTVGQAGKDVVWVPTPQELVEKMLDMANVTPQDFVIDLGSGDGRNVIAAAKRGARALGVEYNPDMVELAERLAREAGVANRATFVQGDMYEADISKATVLALFLLPQNLDKLKDKFLALKPGTRIVLNTFAVTGWEADATERITGECASWCTSMLVIVPAQVAGAWRFQDGTLTLTQEFQKVSGTMSSRGTTSPVSGGRLLGDRLSFSVGGTEYVGRVDGDRIEGTNGWTASRNRP